MKKDDQLSLYKSLFKGMKDLFAIRWEKGDKSSYIPVYHFDPHQYMLHQMKDGTFQTFTDKTYQSLTDKHLIKHLKGEQIVELYPLLISFNKTATIPLKYLVRNSVRSCYYFK